MVNPIPENYPQVTPYLCVDDAEAAIDFYTKVLGAKERGRLPMDDGKLGHVEMQLGDGVIMLSDEFPDWKVLSAKTIGDSPVAISVYVENVDEVFERALREGAEVRQPVEDQFYGDRSGQFIDPFGHRWNVATHIEDVDPEEMGRRAEEWKRS